ncbi:MAG: FAD-dependent oxidoreductase, partial [Peptococcaceae bacterium]|nr:FAD-dependent oxidoreductase [Peptococcaceae bacterium]
MSVQFTGKVLTIATEIANNCQGLEAPFCQAECPMHTDAMGYVQLIREGKFDAAVQKIREKLFLPGTLGRICAHPCEKVCRREAEYGQSISIAALKRYAADKADREELWDTTFGHATGKTVAIVGSGPAGAQAAIDLRKEGHRVTIFERLPVLGGMLRVGIPAYRLPHAVLDFEYGYLDKLGVEIRRGVEVGKDIAIAHLREQYDAVILAHGAHIGMMPRVNGSDVAGITNAVEFLREIAFKRQSNVLGENVIVIGGGDVAMDCARSALRGGAKQVRLICLEKECDLPASKHEQESAAAEGVLFTFGWCVDDFLSTDGRVSGIRMKNCLAVIDETGRFNPRLGGDTHELQCDTVIFATGQRVADIADGMLKQTSGGRYLVDKDTLATDVPGVFVAG